MWVAEAELSVDAVPELVEPADSAGLVPVALEVAFAGVGATPET